MRKKPPAIPCSNINPSNMWIYPRLIKDYTFHIPPLLANTCTHTLTHKKRTFKAVKSNRNVNLKGKSLQLRQLRQIVKFIFYLDFIHCMLNGNYNKDCQNYINFTWAAGDKIIAHPIIPFERCQCILESTYCTRTSALKKGQIQYAFREN